MSGEIVPCPQCGARQIIDPADAGHAVRCWRCDERFRAPGVRPSSRRARPRSVHKPPPDPAAVVSLVLGGLSCAIACAWPLSLLTSTAGLAAAMMGRESHSRPTAVVGLVLNAVGLIFAGGFLALTVAGVSLLAPEGDRPPQPFFPTP